MKSRPLHSKFYTDPYIQGLSLKERWVYQYYLFNDKVNWLGTYEITDRTALFELGDGISQTDLTAVKKKLQQDGKILFTGNYVIIHNSERYDVHLKNPQLMGTALKQFMALPESIKQTFLDYKPSDIVEAYRSMFLTLDYTLLVAYSVGYGVDEVKVKEEVKEEIQVQDTVKTELQEMLKHYNRVFGKFFSSYKDLVSNWAYWKNNGLTLEDAKQAITNGKNKDWWKDNMTLTILLRRTNERKEPVNHIETLKNYKPKNQVHTIN